jgi:hypothetical protein
LSLCTSQIIKAATGPRKPVKALRKVLRCASADHVRSSRALITPIGP